MANFKMYKSLLVVFVLFVIGQLLVCLYGSQLNLDNVPWPKDTGVQSLNVKGVNDVQIGKGGGERRSLKESERNIDAHARDENSAFAHFASVDFDPTATNRPATNGSLVKRRHFDGTRISSFVSASYHKHYGVNCSAVVRGDRKAVAEANRVMGKTGKATELPVPSNEVVQNWTRTCETFRKDRGYPDNPHSSEEGDFPIAFIIVTHKESAQVERLLRAIYQPQNVYCIHPDSKSPQAYQLAIRNLAACFDNVFISSRIESVQYAGFTRLQADINCMADLQRHPVKWHYVMNLCGQDFPLKTNLEMVKQLKTYRGKNDINGILPPPYIRGRTRSHYKVINGKLTATLVKKTPPPHNLTIYFGNAYYAASRAFVDYVINDRVAIDLLEWSKDTYSPDEHYWVTLQRAPGVPGGYPLPTWDANVRFMKWGDVPKHPACQGKYVRALCVFGVGYLDYLVKMPHLFANKFYYSFDPVILQCIEELLDFRTAYPETVSDFVPNFPATDLEWLYNGDVYYGT